MGLSDAFALERCLDSPLWVVTSSDGSSRGGLVATFVNMASIAREMPRMAVGIARQHRTWEIIESSHAFALHLLPRDQGPVDLAARFGLQSGRTVDKFADLQFTAGPSGSPILDAAAGWVDCRVEDRLDTGDRTIYLAEVIDARAPADDLVLTVQHWVRTLTADQRNRLGSQYQADGQVDAAAIRAWRDSKNRARPVS